eukprot:GHVP01006322.1.p1 GENE.GHVP01006322.1~~GHVP01006322.1.p1  ORF type:complete len:177 (-),score=29.33 GHVP01006322.1:123-629(-)
MEFFKNVSDELANAFVGHYPNVENECQQSHALSFRANSDSEPTDDFQEIWDSSNVLLSTPKAVVTMNNWTAVPPTKVIFPNDIETTVLQAQLNCITKNKDIKANIHCEIRDGTIIISWERSEIQLQNPLPVGDNKRYFWYMSEEDAKIERPIRYTYWEYFQELITLQN